MEIIVQPLLVDQLRLLLSSQRLRQLEANDENARLYGLTKKQATQNARFFAESHVNLFSKTKRNRKVPLLNFKEFVFLEQLATSVSLEAYQSFPVRVFGNPTRFQKQYYIEQGLIDTELNNRERLHEDNYIHTDICSLPEARIEQDNLFFFPDTRHIEYYLSSEVLGHDAQGWENPSVYTHASITYIEVNQDLLTPEENSTDLIRSLILFFQSEDGLDHLYKSNCTGMNTTADLKSIGRSIILDYETKGKLKIYPKTKHSLRVEAMLWGNKNILPQLGHKYLHQSNEVIDKLAKPLLNQINIPSILKNQPTRRDLTPWIFDLLTQDPTLLNIANKLHHRKYLTKNEIPAQYRRKGKTHKFKATRHGKRWHYIPRHLAEEQEEAGT